SKISDALDKADRERQKGEQGTGDRPESAAELGGSLSSDLDASAWREFGMMRNLIESQLAGRKFRSLVFSSATSGEGVSTVTANFAKTLADDPMVNVLVVDANPQGAVQHALFGLDNTVGFIEFAGGSFRLEDAIKQTSRKNLSVVTSGTATGGMFQLLGTGRVSDFIRALQPRFHYLLFDAPPVLSYPETAVLGSHTDGVLLVIRALSTRREAVLRARDTLQKSGCNMVGVVLNRYKFSVPEFIYKRV
ncbi:MAG: CpsD/CapB family tyrosine-protein kinase, partial [Candidatus Eisenbacteria bacterium]